MSHLKSCIVTGSAGLIGAEAVRFFSAKGFQVVGIDNDMRKQFFGEDASTEWSRRDLESKIPGYTHREIDIRDLSAIESLFSDYGTDIALIVHTAAQPSHDWAAKDPHTDFSVNASGTLVLLEATRKFGPKPVSSSPQPTRFTAIIQTACHSSSSRRGGRSRRPTRITSTGSMKTYRSTRPSTRCLEFPSSPLTRWSRSTAVTSV